MYLYISYIIKNLVKHHKKDTVGCLGMSELLVPGGMQASALGRRDSKEFEEHRGQVGWLALLSLRGLSGE